ncbi:hypothetical protein B0A55_11785 [Friedmanniomyces simplex]|uniref:Piwi domain-containing protein n=1 Tax=Friedmanniomyces simplex TaxID=329884 RepID=A0A4U0XA98_9PEZI|nr:hypothetical protein B0A55_11785 [Friedmanniomyces simplex]
MIKFAVRQPSANAKSITTVGLSLLRLERTDVVVNARWDLRDKKLLKGATMTSWRCFILLIIIPGYNNTAIYNAVKYTCDVQEGVLCQCVVDNKFAKQQIQYYVNVGLKMNLKLGGVNHSIPTSSFGTISPEKTMFVGLDVTHPSPGSTSSAPSVASIVSSIDRTLGQWPAAIRVQEARKEMITDLTELFQGQLRLWQSKSRSLPANLILYRDGVSEGQYQVVLGDELPSIKKAISNVYPPAEVRQGVPRLSIIIVGKRHHTRFYPTKEEYADKTGNLKNGLVVDRGVTSFCNWDFFLQAHSALHGTARPAHYYVVYDEVLRKLNPGQGPASAADALEKMTHGMCYLFGRATSAVSICPPAYYADLVCERARCYLSEHFAPTGGATAASESSSNTGMPAASAQVALHDAIKDKMFYI